MNKLAKLFKNYSIYLIIVELLLTIISTITIFFYEKRIVLEFSIIFILTLVSLIWLILFNIRYFKNYELNFRNSYLYLNLDIIIYFILNVIGFSLAVFSFNILFILILHILMFVYASCVYPIKNKLWCLYNFYEE